MFWDDEVSEIEKKKRALDEDFKTLLESLMRDYLSEISHHLPSLESELKKAVHLDAFGNEIGPAQKDHEVWSYFAEKNLWENIFNQKYKSKQATYLNHLEDFLSDSNVSPDRHIELFGRGLLWRYYAKLDSSSRLSFAYVKTDDPLVPLLKTLKTFYTQLKKK